MNIIVDNGGYGLDNVGDFSMLQVAITRLNKLFPESEIEIFTEKPEVLKELCPKSKALHLYGRNLLFQEFNIIGKTRIFIPKKYQHRFVDFENKLRHRLPELTTAWICYRLQKRNENCQLLKEFQLKISNASLVVGTGGGYINDSFARHAKQVLYTLGMAQKQNKPTVLFGQGIGPLTDPGVLKIARDILPKVDLIGLRENILGPKLLSELGVAPDRITVTGDDAIELITDCLNLEDKNNVGINIRIAKYSNISTTHIAKIREIINNFTDRVKADLLAIPIAFGPKDSDLDGIKKLIPNDNLIIPVLQQDRMPLPQQIIQTLKTCRIVVTGSYHAGVFALSQGIPVVGLSASKYYVSKFQGLEKQFQGGLQHVILSKDSFASDLEHALENAWECSPSIRDSLLQSARRQVQEGNNFYTRVQSLIPREPRNE